jgi:DNA-directed RNA polymerase subunit F
MKASNTHFEQIPVETVKKIAEELPHAIEIDDVTTETQVEVAPQQKRWREMAQKVQVENDPQRIVKLVEELIAAFDEEEGRQSGKHVGRGQQLNPGGGF